ncbi:MAG: type II toxin-antitoxin system RelE/ParE family toxin [Bacteroidetes bacterium]|nr:MAG: type II toxin-antitoxin system RelE/ParE family toxin [Bacteroidota bacterium]
MSYKVEFTLKAIKDLRSIPRGYQGRILDKAESLSDNPYPRGCLKLKGLQEEFWRIRVGDYRIIYQVDDAVEIIDIRRIGHRQGIY